jgi:hypothetical protein
MAVIFARSWLLNALCGVSLGCTAPEEMTCVPGGAEVPVSEAQGVVNGTCAPAGERFVDHYSCDGIAAPCPHDGPRGPSAHVQPDGERESDPDLAWSVAELESCSCVCCHNNEGVSAYVWSYDFSPAWTDSVETARLERIASNEGSDDIAPENNNGFTRVLTGLPSTDPARFQALLARELERRGVAP